MKVGDRVRLKHFKVFRCAEFGTIEIIDGYDVYVVPDDRDASIHVYGNELEIL